jgi:hypothetical protein
MRGRRTTNHDLARLRIMAGAGITLAEAARKLGMTPQLLRYWEQRAGVRFRRRIPLFRTGPPAAAGAAARVRDMMDRMARSIAQARTVQQIAVYGWRRKDREVHVAPCERS